MANEFQTMIQEEGELLDNKQNKAANATAPESLPNSKLSVTDAATDEMATGFFPATAPDFISFPELGDTVDVTAPDTMEDKSAIDPLHDKIDELEGGMDVDVGMTQLEKTLDQLKQKIAQQSAPREKSVTAPIISLSALSHPTSPSPSLEAEKNRSTTRSTPTAGRKPDNHRPSTRSTPSPGPKVDKNRPVTRGTCSQPPTTQDQSIESQVWSKLATS